MSIIHVLEQTMQEKQIMSQDFNIPGLGFPKPIGINSKSQETVSENNYPKQQGKSGSNESTQVSESDYWKNQKGLSNANQVLIKYKNPKDENEFDLSTQEGIDKLIGKYNSEENIKSIEDMMADFEAMYDDAEAIAENEFGKEFASEAANAYMNGLI